MVQANWLTLLFWYKVTQKGSGCVAGLERTSVLVFGQKTENILGQPETNKETEKSYFSADRQKIV